MQVNFDVDEFLAYLLTGCFLLVSIGRFSPHMLNDFISFGLSEKGVHVTFVTVVAAAALILVLGHLSSVVARGVTRSVLHGFFFNPRYMIFYSVDDKFWNRPFKQRVYDNFMTNFGYTVSGKIQSEAAPRLIRSYVLNHYPATREIRNRIVRARSLCANSVLPVTIFSLSLFKVGNIMSGSAFFILALSMLWKQHDLDIREWKEIYTAFANLPRDNAQG